MAVSVGEHLVQAREKKVCTLKEALNYQNEWIIYKFLESWDVSFEEAEGLFKEVLKWMWINALSKEERESGQDAPFLFIGGGMAFLDEMWHCFILFTHDYHAYCSEKFGFYLHHSPTTKAEKDKLKKELEENPEAVRVRTEQELETQYNYIFDKLGEGTLVTWYSDYTDRYTREQIQKLRKPYA